jgi:hypothetical protein
VAGPRVGTLAVWWYSLSASLWHTAMYDFRPATLGIVALLWLVAEIESRDRAWMVVALTVVAASSREDVAVLAGVALVVQAVARRSRRNGLIGLSSAGVGLWYSLVGSRIFAPFEYFLWYRYADYGDTPGAVLADLDDAIPIALGRLFEPDPIVAFGALLVPMLVVAPLIGIKYAWPGILIMLSNAASADPLVPSIHYQYYFGAVVFLLWGSVHAFRRPALQERSSLALGATALIFLVAGPLGLVLTTPGGRSVSDVLTHLDRRQMAEAVDRVPADASVSGGTYLLPHLAQNPHITPYPGPLVCSPVLLTWYPETAYPDYVVVEAEDREVRDLDLEALGYEMIDEAGGATVWSSSGTHPDPMRCPSVEDARRGLFERVKESARG